MNFELIVAIGQLAIAVSNVLIVLLLTVFTYRLSKSIAERETNDAIRASNLDLVLRSISDANALKSMDALYFPSISAFQQEELDPKKRRWIAYGLLNIHEQVYHAHKKGFVPESIAKPFVDTLDDLMLNEEARDAFYTKGFSEDFAGLVRGIIRTLQDEGRLPRKSVLEQNGETTSEPGS